MATPRSPTASLRGLLAWLLTAPVALASTSVHEAEPNNTPADATAITGAVTLLGSLPQTDQDGFLWTVSDDDAQRTHR